jgi:hypothetical protein
LTSIVSPKPAQAMTLASQAMIAMSPHIHPGEDRLYRRYRH